MPAPAAPTLTLTRVAPTAFSAAVTAAAGVTVRLYYGPSGTAPTTAAPGTVVTAGSFAPTGLSPHGSYVAYAVAGDAASGYSLPTFGWVSLASPDSLSGAIHAWFAADAALAAAVPGGLWTGEVPEGVARPYAWLELPDSTSVPNTVDQLEPCRAVFHVWAVGAEAAEAACTLLRARFDYRQLPPFGDAHCVGMMPRSWRLSCEGLRDPDGRLVFRSVVGYSVLLQRPRASSPGRTP